MHVMLLLQKNQKLLKSKKSPTIKWSSLVQVHVLIFTLEHVPWNDLIRNLIILSPLQPPPSCQIRTIQIILFHQLVSTPFICLPFAVWIVLFHPSPSKIICYRSQVQLVLVEGWVFYKYFTALLRTLHWRVVDASLLQYWEFFCTELEWLFLLCPNFGFDDGFV